MPSQRDADSGGRAPLFRPSRRRLHHLAMRPTVTVALAALLVAQPTGAWAKAPRSLTLAQAHAALPKTVPMLGWTLAFHGAYRQPINIAPCDDGHVWKAPAYVHAEYDSPVSRGAQHATFVVVAVFSSAARASAAMSALTLLARKCPRRYQPPFGDGLVSTTTARRPWGPTGWRGYLVAGTSTNLDERRTEGDVDVFAVRGNVLVEVLGGDDIKSTSLARQSLWTREIATTMTRQLTHQMG